MVVLPFCSDRCSRTIINGAAGVIDSGYRKSGSGSINSMVVRRRPTTARRDVQQTIFDTTGRKVLPFAANNAVDQRVANAISAACDESMQRLNAPNSEVQNVDRINEISSHFENTLRELLNATPG
jgi:hypothetical protein